MIVTFAVHLTVRKRTSKRNLEKRLRLTNEFHQGSSSAGIELEAANYQLQQIILDGTRGHLRERVAFLDAGETDFLLQ